MKTILITGCGSGIGRHAAIDLAKKGHKVIATTHTSLQAEEMTLFAEAHKLSITSFKLDITDSLDRSQIESLDFDVLINNAGIGESGSLAEVDIDRVRNNFEVNVFAPLELSQLALRKMMKSGKGTIIFISSLAGRITMPWLAPYCMTKFALSAGIETMRTEVHRVEKNVHMTLVEPGGYHTGFNQKNINKKYDWMDKESYFFNEIEKIKKEETREFNFTEIKTTQSIVNKIIKAAEAKKPNLRYVAPWWQGFGVRVLRAFGK